MVRHATAHVRRECPHGNPVVFLLILLITTILIVVTEDVIHLLQKDCGSAQGQIILIEML